MSCVRYNLAVATVNPMPGVSVDERKLAEFCARQRVRTLRVFGSVPRGDSGPDSDLDVLLEFEAGVDPDLFELGGMQQDLTDLFGREVDLKSPDMFSAAVLQRIVANSIVGYAA